ncbi:hypothetical protein VTN96DRAFT_5281 [Rasamsonia emersonii]|uniref:BYS1 domain protein n=1 Tax=Rasamsonia emersonii (strain ATCC 16479 / CBS 393.64 / IMI 116815) TaxID=1408163 RepID=A0A0F4Z5M3_RASE3|nr:BYS1 domain protein [Rasamsonia emersonii CBS 393.64]KKA25812.1 BYS1 domain protein [Rasamsonia emersonii CBS 393.64]
MHFLASLCVAALFPLTYAAGNAIVYNNCTGPVYLWSVGSSVSPSQTLKLGEDYTEGYRRDNRTGGITIKITRTPGGLYDGSPQTDFAYTLDGNNQIWYDISDVFGDPFANSSVSVVPTDPSCPVISWANGIPPSGSQTAVCRADSDVQLSLCADAN